LKREMKIVRRTLAIDASAQAIAAATATSRIVLTDIEISKPPRPESPGSEEDSAALM
jgi:hypothetical protein